MFSDRQNESASGAGRMAAIVAIALVMLVAVAPVGGVIAGIGLADGGDLHSGVAVAQSENESGTGDGGDGPGSERGVDVSTTVGGGDEDGDEDGESGNESGGESAMDRRTDSQVQDTPEERNESDAAADNETATDRRANSQVPQGENVGDNVSTGDEYRGGDGDDDDSGVGMVTNRFLGLIEGLTQTASAEFGEAAGLLTEYGTTRAAPGEHNDMSSWSQPVEPLWQGSFDGMWLTRLLAFFLILGGFYVALATYPFNPKKSREMAVHGAIGLVYISKPGFFGAASIHITNGIAGNIAPSDAAFATPEGVLMVLSGVIVMGLLASSSIWVIGLAVAVTVLTHSAPYASIPLLPLAAGLYMWSGYPKSLAQMILYFHGMILATAPLQALGVFITSRMFFSAEGALGSLAGLVLFLGVIYIFFYKFPREIMEKAFDAPITALGVEGAKMSVDGAQNAKSTITNAPDAFKDVKSNIEGKIEAGKSWAGRSGPSSPSSPTPSRTVGQMQSASGGSSQPAGSTGRRPRAVGAGAGAGAGAGSAGFDGSSRPEPNPKDIERGRDRINNGYY